MFLCDQCHLEETSFSAELQHPGPRSFGACEACGYDAACVDCRCFTYAQVIVDLPAGNDERRAADEATIDDLQALMNELKGDTR